MTRGKCKDWAARSVLVAATAAITGAPARGAEIDLGVTDLKARWDNTVQYSAAWRTESPSPARIANPNTDDGDRNFRRNAQVLNRFDLLSELDFQYREFGLRVSGAAWYDDVYFGTTDNAATSPTFNGTMGRADRFADATRALQGRRGEILDAFVFGSTMLGGSKASVRLGRHTLIWGESLLFPTNGIAAAQAPIDAIKATSKPGALAKEVFMPVNQLSGQLDLTEDVSVAGYYQFEWRKTRLNAVGAYLSTVDLLDVNGQRLLLASTPIGLAYATRGQDAEPKQRGQFGVAARVKLAALNNSELGLYALRYDAKAPQIIVLPGVGISTQEPLKAGEYRLAYARNIKLFGASLNTSIGPANAGFEVVMQRDAPIGTQNVVLPPPTGYDVNDPPFARGNSVNAQANLLYTVSSTAMWDSLLIAAELAWNRVLKVTRHPYAGNGGLPPGVQKDGAAIALQVTPSYVNVLPRLNLSVPIFISYTPNGKGGALPDRAIGSHRSGTVSLGLQGEYASVWNFGVSFAHYFGKEAEQIYSDRDFVSLFVKTAF